MNKTTYHFGDLESFKVGSLFNDRANLSKARIHGPPVGGIWGKDSEGACSIVLSGGYVDDIDNLDEIIYTGDSGRDTKTGKQIADQVLSPGNSGLIKSFKEKFPIRVSRGHQINLGPIEGYRYDGLYYIQEYKYVVGIDGFKVYRFHLKSEFTYKILESNIRSTLKYSVFLPKFGQRRKISFKASNSHAKNETHEIIDDIDKLLNQIKLQTRSVKSEDKSKFKRFNKDLLFIKQVMTNASNQMPVALKNKTPERKNNLSHYQQYEKKGHKKINTLQRIKLKFEKFNAVDQASADQILSCKRQGLSSIDIGRKLKVSTVKISSLCAIMSLTGINIPNYTSRSLGETDDKELNMVDMIESYLDENLSVYQICELINVSPAKIDTLIYKHLIKNNKNV